MCAGLEMHNPLFQTTETQKGVQCSSSQCCHWTHLSMCGPGYAGPVSANCSIYCTVTFPLFCSSFLSKVLTLQQLGDADVVARYSRTQIIFIHYFLIK